MIIGSTFQDEHAANLINYYAGGLWLGNGGYSV